MDQPNSKRYDAMRYNRVGKSGVLLPEISLGLWHNFGEAKTYDSCKEMVLGAFDLGITHFDIANNYGPPPGSAEEMFGKILHKELKGYRDELFISTKAGYLMWDGPYGEWGSKKQLVSSLDQSLRRIGVDYVDLFYHHRPDPNTPLEETIDALKLIVRQGKALYVGISNYSAEQTAQVAKEFDRAGLHCLIHQVPYSMFNRTAEEGLFDVLEENGIGAIAFMCLAQGLLTTKYFDGIPADSRAASASVFLNPDAVTPEKVEKAKKLNEMAKNRGQSLSQMAIAWCMRIKPVASILIGASRLSQIEENVKMMERTDFTSDELAEIDRILAE
ncbi:aldo/keto reductase [Acutalibacter intestini]|uniref:aldo/keto reductase n=1 Tax=Acutalibacter intestini TaxID=3093659 RepID=UPI002AC904A5|nr:aldo/keto reductase [Acutalibacter sp. M00204]